MNKPPKPAYELTDAARRDLVGPFGCGERLPDVMGMAASAVTFAEYQEAAP